MQMKKTQYVCSVLCVTYQPEVQDVLGFVVDHVGVVDNVTITAEQGVMFFDLLFVVLVVRLPNNPVHLQNKIT